MKTQGKYIVTLGEVMMRLSTPGFGKFRQATKMNVVFGGSEANVAASLVNFGLAAQHVTVFPSHDLGVAATQSLNALGVGTDHIKYRDGRLGLYFLETGAMQRSSKIIYDRFDSAFSNADPGLFDWDTIMRHASWFHWTGITPALSENAATICLDALVAAKKHGVTVSGDINYRRNLWQYGKKAPDVMPHLIAHTDHVVAGAADIENCTGIRDERFEESVKKFQEQFKNVKSVATTNRDSVSSSHNRISATMIHEGRVVQSKEYDLTPIVDRIGAGDAFMAGLIYGWISDKNPREIVEFAAACCAWKHSIEGDVNLASVEEINGLVKGENTGRLLR